MSHAPKCKCDLCGLIVNRRTWLSAAKVMRAIHSKIAKSELNPAYLVAGKISERWSQVPKEDRSEAKMRETVDAVLKETNNDSDGMWPLTVLGCTKVHAQASDVRSQSPFDHGSRPNSNPMFFATTYLGYHRVTVSIA